MSKTELSFHEQMTGYFTWGADDPRTGEQSGKQTNSWFGFDLTIFVDDLDAFCADRNYAATVSGKYLGNLFGPGEVKLESGTFRFMSTGRGDTRLMEHRHQLEHNGKKYSFEGTKYLDDDPLQVDMIHDLTTLYSVIKDDAGKIVASGVLHFPMKDFAKLVASFDTRGPGAGWGAKMKFLRMFLRQELHVLLEGFREPPAPSNRRRSLVAPRSKLATRYDAVIIGSGYGGGAVAKTLASWRDKVTGKAKSVALFERGKEWRAGDFPDEPWELPGALQHKLNPGGLLEFHFAGDIDVLVGNGLGGTSLINANVMIEPEHDVFERPHWPSLPSLKPYFDRARKVIQPSIDPDPPLKSQVFRAAAKSTNGCTADELVPLAVAFSRVDRTGDTGNVQDSCTRCGGCVTGCNFTAKSTVDMNYLSIAERAGLEIYTQMEVLRVESNGPDVTLVVFDHAAGQERTITAGQVIISAGTLGSFSILARSQAAGLPVSAALGHRFSGNGDVLGIGYNGEKQTAQSFGTTITSVAKYWGNADKTKHFIIEEGGVPRALTALVRGLLIAAKPWGMDTNQTLTNELHEWLREKADLLGWQGRGALEHSLTYLAMGFEEKLGRLLLDGGKVKVDWQYPEEEAYLRPMHEAMWATTNAIDGTYIDPASLPGLELLTVHPLGGCVMGDDPEASVVDAKGALHGHSGKVFVADGSIVPTPLGVNPALTIAALGEYIAESITKGW